MEKAEIWKAIFLITRFRGPDRSRKRVCEEKKQLQGKSGVFYKARVYSEIIPSSSVLLLLKRLVLFLEPTFERFEQEAARKARAASFKMSL